MKLNREAPIFGGEKNVKGKEKNVKGKEKNVKGKESNVKGKESRKTHRPPTNRQLDVELTKLRGDYRREMDIAQTEIAALKSRLHTTSKVASDANAAIKKRGVLFNKVDMMLDDTKAYEALENYASRTSQIARKVQIELLKTTVMSEVVRANPELLSGTIVALDELDEWWHSRENYTLEQWRKTMKKLTLIKQTKEKIGA